MVVQNESHGIESLKNHLKQIQAICATPKSLVWFSPTLLGVGCWRTVVLPARRSFARNLSTNGHDVYPLPANQLPPLAALLPFQLHYRPTRPGGLWSWWVPRLKSVQGFNVSQNFFQNHLTCLAFVNGRNKKHQVKRKKTWFITVLFQGRQQKTRNWTIIKGSLDEKLRSCGVLKWERE